MTRIDAPGRAGPRRGRLAVVAAVVSLVVAGLLVGPTATDDPLDPASVGPEGLRGLVEVLRHNDVDVDVSLEPPADQATSVFVPVDLLTDARRDALLDWVEAGGRLVVADAGSPLHGLAAAGAGFVDTIGPTTRAPRCDLLPEVAAVTHAGWVGYEVPDDATACFALGDDHAWLVATSHGSGEVVALGSAAPFTNRLLDDDDHAVLAASLLAPAPGDRLRIAPRPPLGEGETSLLDLVDPRVWQGLALLLGAVVVAAIARGRRLGRPVAEQLPPVLPSIELTNSLAQLLQRAGRPAAAATRLRADARGVVAHATGQPPHVTDERLVAAAVARLGVSEVEARTALLDQPEVADADLLTVQKAVRRLRHAATHAGTGDDAGDDARDAAGDEPIQR
ncbi:DUF4350 domain-containing protein [Egicoccus sp. AB-alg2]|uniref:DUF4350 domain-containing protein n=1 Tax=Egicoccus sp. AB-alg2 TaxID=3242693 RepID=UPI00359DA751